MTRRLRTLLTLGIAAVLALVTIGAARAQAYPSRPVRIIVPLAAGGTGDTLARTVAEEMSSDLAQSVVVENKPGAGGLLGTEIVASAPGDGYTLLLVSPSHVINPALHAPRKTYDPIKGFEPITVFANTHQMIAAHPSVPVNNLAELIAYAKKNPGSSTTARPAPVRQRISTWRCSCRWPGSTSSTSRTRGRPRRARMRWPARCNW